MKTVLKYSAITLYIAAIITGTCLAAPGIANSASSCGFPPLPPIPPIGTSECFPVCICDTLGNCEWKFECR